MNIFKVVIGSVAILISQNVNAAIITDGSQITGITEVNINGTYYDATLHNTLTVDMIPSNPFSDAAWAFATDASEALFTLFEGLYQDSIYDNQPWLALGCESPASTCAWYTPVGLLGDTARGRTFVNRMDNTGSDDFYVSTNWVNGILDTDYSHITFLTWAESEAVPEPSILALMAAGLAGLGFTARRRKQQG